MITKATAAVYMDPTLKLIQRQRTTQSRSHGTVLNVNCDSNVASCLCDPFRSLSASSCASVRAYTVVLHCFFLSVYVYVHSF